MKEKKNQRVIVYHRPDSAEVWQNLKMMCHYYGMTYHKLDYAIRKYGEYKMDEGVIKRQDVRRVDLKPTA